MMRAIKPLFCTNKHHSDRPRSSSLTWNFFSFPLCYMDVQVDGKTIGRITIQLRVDLAPETCDQFRSLCIGERESGFAGTTVHCILPKVLMEAGVRKRVTVTSNKTQNVKASLNSNSRLPPIISRAPNTSPRRASIGSRLEDASSGIKHLGEGVVSMATNGRYLSPQFSITFRSAPWMDLHNVAFGRVVQGLDILFQLEQLGTKYGLPSKQVIIKKCGQL